MSKSSLQGYWAPVLPLIAILRGIRAEDAPGHVQALVTLGFDAIEIPLNSPNWAQSLRAVIEQFGDRAWIGGGTVLEANQVDQLKALGARLVIAPNTRPAVIRHAVSHGLTPIPGVATPTEAFEALDAGAAALKIFPADGLSTKFVRAVRAVLPPVSLYAVGGITPDNLGAFLTAGCAGAGLGSHLYRPDQPVSRTETMATQYLEAFREARNAATLP